jgi:hypothetical protein
MGSPMLTTLRKSKSLSLIFLLLPVGILVLCHFMVFCFVVERKALLSLKTNERQEEQQQGRVQVHDRTAESGSLPLPSDDLATVWT